MDIDFSPLSIKRVIIHQVVKQRRSDTKVPPTYSEVESHLDKDLRLFLKDRIITALGGNRSYQIVFDQSSSSPIQGLFAEWIAADSEFVEISKKIADHLNAIQTGRSPGGLVTIIVGTVSGTDCLAVLKLEKEEGARLEQTRIDGKNTFDMVHIRDLILSQKTRLFKIALFLRDGMSSHGFDGKLCDNQLTPNSGHDVAEFFLRDFLGCTHAGDPRAQTKEFFVTSQEFINGSIDDPTKKSQYELHLLSYLSKDSAEINPDRFAREHFAVADRQPFVDFLERNGVPNRTTRKDPSLIRSRLEKLTIEFDNDVRIIAKREKFSAAVALSNLGDGRTRAEVTGKLRRIR
jgi:nucleoid-associated protein YejK